MSIKYLVGLVAIIVSVLFIVGCTPSEHVAQIQEPAPEPVIEPEPVVKAPEEVVMEEPEPVTVEDERPPMKRDIIKLLDKVHSVDRADENYYYLYSDPISGSEAYEFYVKGDKMRIDLFDPVEKSADWQFNTVYLDRSTKQAEGYCMKKNTVTCFNGQGPFDVDYDDYIRKTPLDWMKDIDYLQYVGSEEVLGRQITHATFEDGPFTTNISFDSFYGYPTKITREGGLETEVYEFRLLEMDVVTDYDVKLPVTR